MVDNVTIAQIKNAINFIKSGADVKIVVGFNDGEAPSLANPLPYGDTGHALIGISIKGNAYWFGYSPADLENDTWYAGATGTPGRFSYEGTDKPDHAYTLGLDPGDIQKVLNNMLDIAKNPPPTYSITLGIGEDCISLVNKIIYPYGYSAYSIGSQLGAVGLVGIDAEIYGLSNGSFSLSTPAHCFPSGTLISCEGGGLIDISAISPGIFVSSYACNNYGKHGNLIEKCVSRVFKNITKEWLILSFDRGAAMACLAAFGDQTIELPRHPLARQRRVGDQGEVFPRAIINHRENPKASSIGQRVGDKIKAPALVRLRRDQHRRSRSDRPLASAAPPHG